jgi:hypothetical protein
VPVPAISLPLVSSCQIVASWLLFCAQIDCPQPLENFVRAKCATGNPPPQRGAIGPALGPGISTLSLPTPPPAAVKMEQHKVLSSGNLTESARCKCYENENPRCCKNVGHSADAGDAW